MNLWMDKALEEAEKSLKRGEVPVGCLFIFDNQVIASGSNTVNETKNATRHAELNCIDDVLTFCKEKNLNHKEVFRNIDVVVTVEPCIMCASALHQLEIRSIVYGCANDRFGGCQSVFDVSKVHESKLNVTGDVKSEEAMQLLKDFYKGSNPNAPEAKKGRKKKVDNE
ncbi:hypothetical protein QAD02_001698 [Eretmocerus hayati]|uniref:Uncharacterized protein n=1 Tax=Eretmocerus hayati TaxID=131215 RepID=A0ACC2NH45_9HYME|nr:hypothetical protein QAD02_001698 [Eretmocerus hayati]